MPKTFCLLLLLHLFAGQPTLTAQMIVPVAGQPSPEVFDLLKDSKGYLWVAHDQGLSRYDGTTFINLCHPQQNSLSVTGLAEDRQGRIWCHDDSGQIFYIENLQMHRLAQYPQQQRGYPDLVICGDELIATTAQGLFVYHTQTAQVKQYALPRGVRSLTAVESKVVCFGAGGWFGYSAGKPPGRLAADERLPRDEKACLQKGSRNHTFYLVHATAGTYYQLSLHQNTVSIQWARHTASVINTISVRQHRAWIHTKDSSFTTDGKEIIRGMNLSDVVLDNQGQRWLGSLRHGLCAQYKGLQPEKVNDLRLAPGDDIRKIHVVGGQMYLSSDGGSLHRLNTPALHCLLLSVPRHLGAIEQMVAVDSSRLLLLTAAGLYAYQAQNGALTLVPLPETVKEIAVSGKQVYIATTAGIRMLRVEQLDHPQSITGTAVLFNRPVRCRSLAVSGDSLLAAYNDGVYILYKNTIRPLLYKQRPVHATSIAAAAGKVVISTVNQGLLVVDGSRQLVLTEKNGLASNTVRSIKNMAGSLWLVYKDRFQRLNAACTGVENPDVPFAAMGGIHDFGILNQRLYVATGNGLYSMPLAKAPTAISTATYIDKITVNGKDFFGGNRLKHHQNFLQLKVSTPFFSPQATIVYQYRMGTTPNGNWQQGAPGQRAFNLLALDPGSYVFEVRATDESGQILSRPAVYQFEILPPWHQHGLFQAGLAVLTAALSFYGVRLYSQRRLRQQRQEYEKLLAIQQERQRISAEIHDDVGAGLSAVRLLTELTASRLPQEDLRQEMGNIQTSITELTHKVREVIWSLNEQNDKLENLLHYMHRQAVLLFASSPIQLKIILPQQAIPDIVVKSEKRRHLYLAVKEALHNCLKHSGAQNCELAVHIDGNTLRICVSDDGRGLANAGKPGVGLTGMKNRMQQVSGYFEIQWCEKTTVHFRIPLNELHV